MLAQASALLAASTFLPRQGTSTRFATGSQIMPRMFCSARDAAATACPVLPFASVTNAAAAIPEPAPHSAWQPPVSAAKVAWAAMKTPIMPAASIPFVISSSDKPMSLAAPMQAPGNPPHAPAVGAATITPIELFVSIRAVT